MAVIILKVALTGNPNCGKSTLFNAVTGAHVSVGNWAGVTVDIKRSKLSSNRNIEVYDLPGMYSLTPYTSEEAAAYKVLKNNSFDLIVNVIDATLLERGLYLTTQLQELGIPMLIVLNMMDVVIKRNDRIDTKCLSKLTGCDVVCVSASKLTGIDKLMAAIENNRRPVMQSKRLYSLQERYAAVSKIYSKCYYKNPKSADISRRIDKVLTGRYTAYPMFLIIISAVYLLALGDFGKSLSSFISDGIFSEQWVFFGKSVPGIIKFTSRLLDIAGCQDVIVSLINDGIIRAVGSVLAFLPQLAILFIGLALLEDCGYMSRAAYISDRMLSKFGLSGRAFIPMIIATGCGVPAVMSSRTCQSDNEKLITAAVSTFMPCSAKLPLILMISETVSGMSKFSAPCMYIISVCSVLLSGMLLSKRHKGAAPFILELPSYHIPSFTTVWKSVSLRLGSFIKKAGTVIVLASIIIWFLSSFGMHSGRLESCGTEYSMLASIGKLLHPFFKPLGWRDWRYTVATLAGITAKENTVSTLKMLGADTASLPTSAGWSFMVFNVLCTPCIAAIAAMLKEIRSVRRKAAVLCYQCAFAYVTAAAASIFPPVLFIMPAAVIIAAVA